MAEILWLAVHTSASEGQHGASASGRPGAAEDLQDAAEQPVSAPDAPVQRAAPPGSATTPVRTTRHRELHVPSTAEGEGTGGTGVLVPTAPMLDHPLGVQRALRPLKRRVPSRWVQLLDEDATAARIADQQRGARPWVPVMTAAPERWLSLVFVVDASPSMRLWRPLAQELHETLTRLGAFRDLRICYLTGTGPDIGVRPSPGAPPTDPATLIDPSGRQVILLLSDCSGGHWWDGRADRALRLWAHAGPTAVLQPLAERLWRRTAASPVPGTVFAARPCAPNTALHFAPYDGDFGKRTGAVPVPILECAPDWLADWAGLVAGSGGPRPAAMIFVRDRHRRGTEPIRQEHRLPIDERVQRFQTAASPEAARLAAHVAVSFPALPVMRLIQHQILPSSQPGHLAEVLLSGLLRTRDTDRGLYDFVPGAREALLTTLPRSESWHTADVLTRISAEIERRADTLTETFRACLPTEHGTGDQALGPEDRPFALVSSEAIRLLDRTAVTALADAPLTATESPVPDDGTSESSAVRPSSDEGRQAVQELHLPDPDNSSALFFIFDVNRNPARPFIDVDVRELRETVISPHLIGMRPKRCPVRIGLDAQKLHAQVRTIARTTTDTLIVYVTGRLLTLRGLGTVLASPGPVAQIREQALRLSDLRRQVRNSAARNRVLVIDGVHDASAGARPSVGSSMSFGPDDAEANTYELIGVREPGGTSLAQSMVQAIQNGLPGGGPGLTIDEIGNILEMAGAGWNTVSVERGGPFHLTRNTAYSV
ncbi:SAV_2336 N-terminal domain-related protein [Actinomadura sp. HBU206391]|uniref:SAV_2336 N-terminal domain-related protein n=1 Tax=Actinomadura sp. HBU206391 TaxID=2731692 RepID=UPI00164F4677|nr:SAV_2336 N-terminal domain-related protein [Actinomadura sp. HBU206391]MBC6458159.1 hypothetical protein [Actinomadura sp. HBU206391]